MSDAPKVGANVTLTAEDWAMLGENRSKTLRGILAEYRALKAAEKERATSKTEPSPSKGRARSSRKRAPRAGKKAREEDPLPPPKKLPPARRFGWGSYYYPPGDARRTKTELADEAHGRDVELERRTHYAD